MFAAGKPLNLHCAASKAVKDWLNERMHKLVERKYIEPFIHK